MLRLGNKWWWPVEPIAIHPRGNVRLCLASPVPLTNPCQCYLPLAREILMANPDWQCGRSGIADFRAEFFHLTKCVQLLSRWIHLLPLMILPPSLFVWRISNLRVNVIRWGCAGTACGHLTLMNSIAQIEPKPHNPAPSPQPTPHFNPQYQVLQLDPTQIKYILNVLKLS